MVAIPVGGRTTKDASPYDGSTPVFLDQPPSLVDFILPKTGAGSYQSPPIVNIPGGTDQVFPAPKEVFGFGGGSAPAPSFGFSPDPSAGMEIQPAPYTPVESIPPTSFTTSPTPVEFNPTPMPGGGSLFGNDKETGNHPVKQTTQPPNNVTGSVVESPGLQAPPTSTITNPATGSTSDLTTIADLYKSLFATSGQGTTPPPDTGDNVLLYPVNYQSSTTEPSKSPSPLIWIVLAGLAIGLVWYFKRKKKS